MKKLLALVFGLALLLDFGSKVNAAYPVQFTMPDQYNYLSNYGKSDYSTEAADIFSAYTQTTVDYNGVTVPAYDLEEFIDDTTAVAAIKSAMPDQANQLQFVAGDVRELFTYVIRSNYDQFTNRTRFVQYGYYNYDLKWDIFNQGYLLLGDYLGRSFYPPALGLPGMFNNKWAYDIFLFRKIDVKQPDSTGTLITFEPAATTTSYVDDSASTYGTTKFEVETKTFGTTYTNVTAISLDQFITGYVTDMYDSYDYRVVDLDGDYPATDFSWDDMYNAYYLPDYDLCFLADPNNNYEPVSGTTVYYPATIEMIGATYSYDNSAQAPPAFAAIP